MNLFPRLRRRCPPPIHIGLMLLQAAAVLMCLHATVVSAAPHGRAKPNAHVYLLRGAFNIFSLGMDAMADRLRRQGVTATVDNYLSWPSLADAAAAEYRTGRARTIIIVGHSSGATAVTKMAARLGEFGVPVKLAIGLDPTSQMTASGRVDRYINYYIANGMGNAVRPGPNFSGAIENVDVEQDPVLNHFNIDKDRALQEQVLREICAAL
jgi:hypothetical protein